MVMRISRKKWIGLCLLIFFILTLTSYGQNRFKVVYIGQLSRSPISLKHLECEYPIYEVKGQRFISVSTIEALGIELKDLSHLMKERQKESKEQEAVYMCELPLYCGNIRSFALASSSEIYVPVELLKSIGKLVSGEAQYVLEQDLIGSQYLFEIDEIGIENKSDHIESLRCKHLYWNGKSFIWLKEDMVLESGEKKAWEIRGNEKELYITTLVEVVNEWPIEEAQNGYYGQCNEAIFNQYSESLYLEALKGVFPRCIMLGEMKQGFGKLKAKDKVEIIRIEKHRYTVIQDSNGKKHQVPYEWVRLLGEKGACYGRATKEAIEDFATLNHIQSKTDYLLWTDLYRQRTYVLKREQDQWKLIQKFVCSTGKKDHPTPSGIYEIQYKIPFIGVQKGYRCKYALVFFRDYMYHSILFDPSGKYIKSGQYELGSKASHGCIRLTEKDSKWLYEHIPLNTTVWIR